MGLSDIFGEADQKSEETPSNTSALAGGIEVPTPLRALASEAAVTSDRSASVASQLAAEEKRLRAEADERLRPLRDRLSAASSEARDAATALRAAMDAAGVSKVPMPDRKPISIKVKVGSKKSITKTWLVSTLGGEKAEEIWSAVPRNPDTSVIEIPRPFDDQPND